MTPSALWRRTLLVPLAALALGACSDSDSDDDTRGDDPASETTPATDGSSDSSPAPAGDATMTATFEITGGPHAGSYAVESTSAGACSLGLLTASEYTVAFTAPGDDATTVEGATVYGLGIEAVLDPATGEAGADAPPAQVGFSFTRTSAGWDIDDEDAEVTVSDGGGQDPITLTFSGESEDGVAFSGTATCTALVRVNPS